MSDYTPPKWNWTLDEAVNREDEEYIEFDTWLDDVDLTDAEKFDQAYWDSAGGE